jgi:two-component system sensor histidine kinase UhpB
MNRHLQAMPYDQGFDISLLRRAADAAQDIIWEHDLADGRIHFSEHLTQLLGYTERHLGAEEFAATVLHPDDFLHIRGLLLQAITTGQDRLHFPAHRMRRSDGGFIYAESHIIISRDDQDNPISVTGVTRDITRQYRNELELQRLNQQLKERTEQLQASMDRYDLVAKATSDIIWDWNLLTNEDWFSGNVEGLFGYVPGAEPAEGDAWLERLHPHDRDRVVNSVRAAIDMGQPHWEAEYRFRRPDGSWATILDRGYTLFDTQGRPVRMIGSMQDISHLKELQERIVSEKVRFQQGITRATIRSQEREREALGRELHDNINQILASCKLMTEVSVREVAVRDTFLPRTLTQLSLVIEEIRRLTRSLAPPALGEIGLSGSLQELVDGANHSCSTKFTLIVSGDVQQLPDEAALMLYRIVQEGVHNIQKYASAAKASITLNLSEERVDLQIADNGAGFDLSDKRTGIGFRNIRSRIQLFSGSLDIDSAPGLGCRLRVQIPLHNMLAPS